MYRVTKQIDFCYGHRLRNYDGKCRHVHGHNGTAEIDLESPELDDRGMVMDFSEIKRDVKAWIDREIDHTMLFRHDDPLVEEFERMGEQYYTLEKNPTAEAIAELIYRYADGEGYPVTAVRLWETPTSYATYEP